ncbi:MAG: hypothetical protein AB4426_34665 [Xenococcaceae cyanobacterium]
MSDEELKQLVASNARAIESLTANLTELTRDRAQMYQLMADLAKSEAETKREMYRMMGNFDQQQNELSRRQEELSRRQEELSQRQEEIVKILKLLTQEKER